MISIDRIVCPLDFSEASRSAFDHAVALARRCDAHVTAVHVVPPQSEARLQNAPSAPGAAAWPGKPDPAAPNRGLGGEGSPTEALDWITDPARQCGVNVDPVIVGGRPVSRILEHADARRADVVVMGTHGWGGFEPLVMGSVAEKIVRKAPCPVLTVSPEAAPPRTPLEPGFFDRIVCAVDFSEASLKALEYAYSLGDGTGSEVAVLHVLEPPASSVLFPRRPQPTETDPQAVLEAQTRLASLLPANVREVADPLLELRVGRPHEQILRFARERKAQVIVMGVHGRGRGVVERMFLGSVTNQVVRSASCPVLSVREETPSASRVPRGA